MVTPRFHGWFPHEQRAINWGITIFEHHQCLVLWAGKVSTTHKSLAGVEPARTMEKHILQGLLLPTWVISHVPMFHITQPLGIWSIMATIMVMSNIPKMGHLPTPVQPPEKWSKMHLPSLFVSRIFRQALSIACSSIDSPQKRKQRNAVR